MTILLTIPGFAEATGFPIDYVYNWFKPEQYLRFPSARRFVMPPGRFLQLTMARQWLVRE